MDCPVQLQEREIRNIVIRPVEDADSVYLAQHLRMADVEELYAAYGLGPLEALEFSIASSKGTFVAEHRGRPALIFGVQDLPEEGQGCIWMLGTDAINEFKLSFLRHSGEILHDLCAGFDLVMNYVDARNTASIRWLKAIGATFIVRHEQFGFSNKPFLEFVLCVES